MTLPSRPRPREAIAAAILAMLALFALPAFLALAAFASRDVTTSQSVVAAAPFNASIVMSIHDADHDGVTSISLDQTFHARVRVSGAATVPTGFVVVSFYDSGDCSGPSRGGDSLDLVEGLAHFTKGLRVSEPGTWSVKARYGGSGLYNPVSICKLLTVTKATVRFTLSMHDAAHKPVTTVYVNQPIHLRARLTSAAGEVTGDVAFSRSTESDCGGAVGFEAGPLVDGALETQPFVIASRSTVYYRAKLLPNVRYVTTSSPCIAVSATKAPSSITLTIHDAEHDSVVDPVALGTQLHPLIRLSGPTGTPTGWIELRRFDGSTCTGTPATFSTVLHSGEFDPTDILRFARSTPGDSAWQAHYRGSAAYSAKTSACKVLRWRATPEIPFRDAHTAGHARVTSAVPVGTPVHLIVQFSGPYGKPTGDVEIRSFSDGACSKGMQSSGDISYRIGSGALDAGSFTRTRSTAGKVSFLAIFKADLDSNYLSTTVPCLAVSFVEPTPTVRPTATPRPTAASTPRATPRPSATAAAGPLVGPSPVVTPDVVPPTAAPSDTAAPGPSAANGSSAEPAASGAPGPGATEGSAATPDGGPTPEPDPAEGAAPGGLDPLLLLVFLAVLAVVAGTFYRGRLGRTTGP